MSTVVPETRALRPTSRSLALSEAARRRLSTTRVLVAGVVGLATVAFLVRLGHSSFFIDEVYSYNVASAPLSGMWEGIRAVEVTPPLYYYLLHGWIALTGADSEAALRLPSALAGVALAGAVMWLGTIVGGRRAGALAGVLTALSPLTLQYSQEVRSYVWVMLAVTVAVAAVVRCSQTQGQLRWLALAAVASILAIAFNYTAGLITGPLALWLLAQRDVALWKRLLVLGASGLPLLALLPLLSEQMAAGHHSDDSYARITSVGLIKLVGTPFDGRGTVGTTLSLELGLFAVVDAIALMAWAQSLRALPARRLIVFLAAAPVALVILISTVAHPMAITRYTAVVAPFMLVTIGVAAVHSSRAIGMLLAGAALLASVIGFGAALAPSGQFPASRSALTVAGAKWQAGDQLVTMDSLGYRGSLLYYTDRLLPKGTPEAATAPDLPSALDSGAVRTAVKEHRRLWLMSAPPMWMEGAKRLIGDLGYRIRREWSYAGQSPVQLLLVVPRR